MRPPAGPRAGWTGRPQAVRLDRRDEGPPWSTVATVTASVLGPTA